MMRGSVAGIGLRAGAEAPCTGGNGLPRQSADWLAMTGRAGPLTMRRADAGIGPYFTLQDLGMKSSPNCSTAYLSVMPDM